MSLVSRVERAVSAHRPSIRVPQIDGPTGHADGKAFEWDNDPVPLGIYISVPFCKTKCSYCNFASDVFSRAVFERYVDRVCLDIANGARAAAELGGRIEREVDSIYLGGGTPTVLDVRQLQRMFDAVREHFSVQREAEITVECAPGTLSPAVLEGLLRCGVNRVSLGVQSFVDAEAAAVGRLHKRSTVLDDIERLRAAGIANINVDLIAGLPHQTAESWKPVVGRGDRYRRAACQRLHARSG